MAGPDAQTRMMERLLADPEFRARFRRAPAAVAREEGMPELAEELSLAGDPMQTLDFRESRSSVAGVMMAAAVEGLGIYELGRHVFGVDDAQAAAGGTPPRSAASNEWDPDQFGQGGSGGQPSAEAVALLENKNVRFDASGVADLKAGRMDPRVVGVLDAISEKHQVTVSSTTSDHPKLTAGGSVSNHFYGRAFDIATVDGKPVNSGNQAARQLAQELSRMDSRIRPSEIGSPWALQGAAYFTDAAHQDHLHIGFDDPIAADWSPPAGSPVSSPAAVDMPAVPDAPPEDGANGAGTGMAVNPDDAAGDEDSDEPDSDAEDSDAEEGGGDEDEPDEDEAGHDAWDETHESGSDEDSGGSGDDGSSESGSDEDDGGSSDDGSDSDSDSDSAPDAAAPDDGLEVPDTGGDYPGDDAKTEEVAAWMASAAQKRGLPPELPVMAALVESGMKNLEGGDADSAGFFQMRVGIWDNGEYSGYRDKPELQLQWFLDHAAAMRKQRVAGGQSVKDPKQYGEWIADVERPAAQYRGRYQLQLDEAQALLKKAGARSGGKSGGDGAQDLVDGNGDLTAGRRARAALTEARKYLGTPYLWGGSTPKTGFDCSGLVQWAYAKAGIRIPRVTDQQILAANGTKVSRGHLLPGDLVFFKDPTGYVHHVGISLGGNRFLHAPHTGDVVKISSLKESYYAQQFAGGRRFDRAIAAAESAQAASARPRLRSAEDQAAQLARAALDRDAAEVRRSDSALFRALERQESSNRNNQVQFMRAVEPVR